MRRAAAVDANQRSIVEALRKAGCSVLLLHRVGQGCPDVLAGKDNRNVLIEIKSECGMLTPAEVAWLHEWRGQAAVCYTVDDALRTIGVANG